MKQRYNALTTLAVVLLAWVVVMAAASVPAFAEEGEAQSEGRDLLELLEEQGIRKDGDASALTIQGLGAKVANLDAGSASEANKKIKERTKQGFHIIINMTADWNNKTIEIPSGADVTIKMNGHTINRNRTSGGRNDSAIQVGSNALLSIDGGTKTSFKGMRIYSPSGSYTMQSRNVAGLITGGYNTNGGGGIDMAGGSSVTLNNVYLAGNRAEQNWGTDGHGGGIYVGGENTSITLNNTQIMGNYAYDCGGGIYANNAVCLITLNKSTLDGNVAARGTGGGIHCDSTGIHISGDPTSSIRYSYAKSNGGGVYFKKDSCSLKGLKVESNRSDTATGGGAYANAKKTTFANLTITNNKATYAGGLRTMGADESITSCTITNNATYSKDSSYGAGACIEGYTSTISGTCVIKDNQGNNGVYLAPEITGTPDNTRGGFVKLDLARGSSVCVIKGSPGHNYVPITPTDARVPNCIRYLTTMNGYHVTYNDSSRVIYIVKGSAGQNENSTTGKAARIPQAQTTLNPSQTTPATTGEKYNGRDVVRGYVRYPSVEDGTKDFATSFYYSDGYFLDNPTKYNNHLATLSMCMAMSGFYLNAGGTTDYFNKHASARQFMSDIGCADDDIYVNDYNVQKPGSFTIGVTIASKAIKDASGVEYTLVPIAVRGAGYEAEWTSNVTMKAGVGTEHWGFADAANKVTAEVNSYLARHNLTEKAKQGKVKFWIAGYSRAGATSNLTARRLLDQYASGAKKCDVFGYPIEAPQGGSDDYDKANPERYYSIHNVINKADLVPLVGPTKMGFKRYGVDHYIPGSAAGNAAKSSARVDRAGGLGQTAGTNFSGHEPAVPLVTERTVNTWSDNQSYATNSGAKYNAARSTMLSQMEAVDPSINFDDFFHTADMDFFPSPDMRYKAAKAGGNEEEFIVQFINDVQRWAIGNRASYSKNLETAFQNVIGTVFSMDSASMQGFTNRASTCMDRIPTVAPFSSKRSLRNIYADVIGAWHKRNEKEKKQYIDTFITAIDGTGAYDYLTAEQKAKVRGSLPTFLDFAFKIVDGDYNNESFGGTAKCMMLPTFALNASRIMSNHYPEVNLAWLRAEDSYYNNDKTAYVIAKADRVASPAAKVGSQELATTENTVPTGLRVVTLDVKDLKGEAVYYKVSKNGKQVSENTCKNAYEIYRGPFRISFEKNATYTVTAYAMWHGTKSGEVTYTIKTLVPEHKVTILNAPNMEASKGKVITAKEGEKVELKAERRVVQSDTRESVFTKWTITDEKGTNRTNLLPQGTNTNNTILTLPVGDQSGLSANYSFVAKANYETRLRTDNLHEIKIFVGNEQVKTFKAREGETVTYTPTLDAGRYNDHWTAKLERGTSEFNVTDALKPQLGGVWAGKKSSELRFVVPRQGDALKVADSSTSAIFQQGDKLSLDTTAEQKIKKVVITEFPDPQAETASGKYTCRHYVSEQEFLVDYTADASAVKWDKSVQTKVNRDTTTTTTTTYTTYVVTNWSSAYMYFNNVQVTTNVDNCTATVESYQDGKVRIRLQVVKSQTTGTPKNTIYCNAYDINDEDKTPLAKDGQAIETWRVIEGMPFVADWSPSVPGGQPTWNSCAPGDSGLKKREDGKYEVKQGSNAKLLLNCEQKPVINNIEVKAFPAPKVGESLATAGSEAINLAFNKPTDSVFTANYAPQITSLTWIPNTPATGKAEEKTQYTCIIKLECADNKQIYLDRNTTVSVAEGLGVTTSRFLLDRGTDGKLMDGEGTLFLTFQTTSRSTDHTVTVKDNADAGDPATHTWKEGEAKTVAAKDDYADKVFERWAVTVTPKSGDPVSPATDEQLQAMGLTEAMGLTAAKLAQPSLTFTMPTVSAEAGATFGEGYALSLAAVYHDKADKLFVNNIEPTVASLDLADTAALTWHWMANETEQTGTATVDVVWTAESAYSETTGTHIFTATMRLDAQSARQLKRGSDVPSVFATVANDLYTAGVATWNADGSLTVSVSYGPVSVPLPAYQVSVGAYDANSPTSKLKTKEGDSLVDMPDVAQVVVSETGDSDGFSLAAPVIDGAKFVRWEIPTGSKIERVGGQDSNKFKFTSDATAQDVIAIHALYQPVVSKVTLEVVAPKAGEALATKATASIALANADAFTSVAPSVAATNLTWTPNVNSAAYDTEYAAAATLGYKVKTVDDQGVEQVTNIPWVCGYAEDVEVTCASASFTWLDTSDSAVYAFFPATERDNRHQVTIRDFAEDDEDEGEPRQETWYEGETKYLVAKQYDDKLFTGWTIKGAGETDVTNAVLGAQSANPAVAITVPAEGGAGFPEGYALTAVANYKDKIDEVRVTIPQPMGESMGASGTVAWMYNETTTKRDVAITWSASHTEDTSTGDKIASTAYVATLHLQLTPAELEQFAEDPFVVAQLADGSAEDGPQIDAGEVSFERAADGIIITVPFVTTQEVLEARTITLWACDVNADEHPVLDGTEDEEYLAYEDDEDGIILCAPSVEGAVFAGWEYDESVFQKTPVLDPVLDDESIAIFAFEQDAEVDETNIVKALYKPVVDTVRVDFAAPRASEKLATKDDATVVYELANDAFEGIGGTVSELTWTPAHTTADFGEKYIAALTCTPDKDAQYALDDDVVGVHGQTLADFEVGENGQHKVYVDFDATEPQNNHKVTVIDNVGGLPATYLWQEAATKHIVAKPSEDKRFSHWTITDQKGADVTRQVLQSAQVDDATIELNLPVGSGAASFPTADYALTITARYANKANQLAITGLAVPTATSANTTSSWQWTDGTGTYTAPSVDVMWTRASKDDGYAYTATMRLDASKAQGICHNGLQITVNGDQSQAATATWDTEGNLTVTTTFVQAAPEADATFRTVRMLAYDANANSRLGGSTEPLEPLLYDKSYEVLVTGATAKLVPYQVSGGVFSGFAADATTAAGSVVGNVLTLKTGSTGEAVVHANYKPVVNSVRVNVATPSNGQQLSETASASATLASTAFAEPGAVSGTATWKPAGTADATKEYEAAVTPQYKKAADGDDPWQCAYAPESYATTSGPAYTTFDPTSGTAYLYFDENSPTQLISVKPVDDVYTTYDHNSAEDIQALLGQQRSKVNIEVTANAANEATVTWEKPVLEVDGGKLEGAIWHARGKLTLPEGVQAQDLYVTVSVYVMPSDTLDLVHVDQPADIYGLQAGADEATVRDQLPTQTDLILEEGVVTTGTITWNKVECVDSEGTFRYSAKWTATGTVTLPSDVSNPNDRVSLAVTMDVYVDLADLPDNLAEMPYAMPESDIYDTEKAIILDTDEENGTIYYRIASGVKGDYSEIYPSDFREYLGEPIYLDRDSIDDSSMLCIEAYTVAPNKEQSYTATFLYELSDYMYIPEGEQLVFDGTEQVGVWLVDDYELVGPSAGARIDEDGDAVAINAGTYTVVAKAQNKLTWYLDWPDEESSPTTTTDDQTITFTIAPASVKDCDIDLAKSVAYTGRAVTPKPKVTLGDWTAVEGRDYTLTYKDNVTVGKATVTITGKGNLKDSVMLEFEVDGGDQLDVAYAGHVQTYGDIPAVQNGASLGTVGQSKRIESFSATVTGGTIEYRAHVQRQGWDEGWKRDGELCGTTGQSKRVEAVQVRLSDRLERAGYHVWYRVHAQTYGWLGWACDGAPAGTSGQSKRLEAIEMVVLRGDARPEGYDASKTSFNGRVSANAHVQTYGWLGYRSAGKFGTTGKSKRMEAFWLKPDGVPDCGVEYQSHVQRQGWEAEWHANGDISGTMGKSRRVEAVRIRLTGEAAKNLSIWYRVHSQTFGWSGWARDGQDAGTAGYSKRVESIEVVVLSKDAAAPGPTKNALRSR